MLTLVAAVLAYDMALEMREVLSSAVELADMDMDPGRPGRRGGAAPLESRRLRSWTRLEKDMTVAAQLPSLSIGLCGEYEGE